MKNNLLGVLVVAAFSVASMDAAISDTGGRIDFSGEVATNTCTISGDGGGPSFTVKLPPVSVSALSSANASAGITRFKIHFSDCKPTTGNLSLYFERSSNVNMANVNVATDRLRNMNTINPAKNVEVGLLSDDYSIIELGREFHFQNSHAVPLSGAAGTLIYYAQYVATDGAATAGLVSTATTYTVLWN